MQQIKRLKRFILYMACPMNRKNKNQKKNSQITSPSLLNLNIGSMSRIQFANENENIESIEQNFDEDLKKTVKYLLYVDLAI